MHFAKLATALAGLFALGSAFQPVELEIPGQSQSLNPRSTVHLLHSRQNWVLPIGTCNKDTPCANSACCGTNGLCGYSPTVCGSGNCTSNCEAKAQCGQFAAAGQEKCPLNVCCSEFGFCGSTKDFCGWKGCSTKYGGCGDPKRPSCGGGGSVNKRTVGYYESWSNIRKCQQVAPEDLNTAGFTHINFAFAFFDPSSFQITPMDSNGASLYSRFTALKAKQSGLQTWISVGGWSFTDPGATRTAFSDMASSSGNRQKFISGLISFMSTYGFDGVDLDWEYPGADDRGGKKSDVANYVTLLKEMRAAFGSKYGITATLPTSYWYLQHFDLVNIQDSVDWFNLMAYDLHGTWDNASSFVGPYVAPHTNLTEIDLGLDLLWRAGVTPDRVVMGQGWYGRSFELKDSACNTPNGVCQFKGGANPGPCSNASGILDNQEISDIISKNNLKPTWDKTAGVKWVTWDSNQWVSYDDQDTFQQKRDFASKRCLGGLMVWAMDQVDQKGSPSSNGLGRVPAAAISPSQQASAQQASKDQQAGTACYTSDCGATCRAGTTMVTQMTGQPGQLSTKDRCKKKEYQSLCCDSGTTMGTCQWRGYRGKGLSCKGGCLDGETQVAQGTNNHGDKGDQSCHGGTQTYCCGGFAAKGGKTIGEEAGDLAKEAAKQAAEQAAIDIAAKVFCRVAVPALLAPLEALEALIPIVGEIADLIEIAATPAIIEGCIQGIEKAGKAEFKVFGKTHSLDPKAPGKAPDRPPQSDHKPPKTSEKPPPKCDAPAKKRTLPDGTIEKRAPSCKPDQAKLNKVKQLTHQYHAAEDGGKKNIASAEKQKVGTAAYRQYCDLVISNYEKAASLRKQANDLAAEAKGEAVDSGHLKAVDYDLKIVDDWKANKAAPKP